MSDKAELTRADHARNAIEAVVQAVPHIGPALAHLLFGSLAELRMKRVEQTLAEVAAAIKSRKITARIDTEEFGTLLESVAPGLARATNEEKRERFRDLLLNAAQLGAGSSAWQDATLSADLLARIEPPGLAVLGALARCTAEMNTMFARPFPRLVDGQRDPSDQEPEGIRVPYEWIVIEEWVWRLKEQRLIGLHSADARGGFGNVHLTPLGSFFVRWIMSPKDAAKS